MADITRRGGMPVVLGGDHYIAYPSFEGFVRGMAERRSNPRVGYLHIDTHSDFRDEYVGGGRYNHGTAARRVSESPALSYRNMAWLGLNGPVLDAGSYRLYRQHRLKMLTARMIRERGAREVVREAMDAVASETDGVYVSIDIDVVSGADAPGTGASVFTGIQAREFLEIMEDLGSYDIIKAVDLCEVSPPLDTPGLRTADLAVSGLLTLLERKVFERVTLSPGRLAAEPVEDVAGDPLDEPVLVNQAGHPLAGACVEHRAGAPGEGRHHAGAVARAPAVGVVLRAEPVGQVGEAAERPGRVAEGTVPWKRSSS